MKNMTLPAKSSKRTKLGLCSVLCILSAIAVFFAGCQKNEPETFFSDKTRPSWTSPQKSDMSSSMTAMVKVDLKAQFPEKAADFVLDANDLLAAFSGETCLGTASPQDGLFFLYIASPVTGNPSSVTLRYYSSHYKNIFEAKDAFTYGNEETLGSPTTPLTPAFVVAK